MFFHNTFVKDLPTVVVASVFIRRKNKYLLVYDPRFKFWRVPGGKPKFGEKIEDTLRREIKEELNLTIKITKFLGFGQDIVFHSKKKKKISRILLFFEGKILKGKFKIIAQNEILEVKWLTIDEIKIHPNLEPGMIDFLKRFEFK